MSLTNPAESLLNEANKSFSNATINNVKQIFSVIATLLLRGLAVFSNPLFRKNLGERYLNPFALLGVGGLWLLALILSWPFGMSITALIITRGSVSGTHWVSMLTVLAYAGAWIHFIRADLQAAIQRHTEGRPTHSYSFGEARLSKEEDLLAKFGLFGLFLLAAAPLAFAYIASLGASYMQGKFQEAELYGRYLDAVDAMIETEQLESALLGVTPVSNTHLIKPLSNNLPDSIRKNVAAAAAGNVARGLAQPPQTVKIPTISSVAATTPTGT
jgi:hypothetical protein